MKSALNEQVTETGGMDPGEEAGMHACIPSETASIPVGYTRRDYRCPKCHYVHEIIAPLSALSVPFCFPCGLGMEPYFGNIKLVPINLGVQAHHDPITRYQFENL